MPYCVIEAPVSAFTDTPDPTATGFFVVRQGDEECNEFVGPFATEADAEACIIAEANERLDDESRTRNCGCASEDDVRRYAEEIASDLGLSVTFDRYSNPTFRVL